MEVRQVIPRDAIPSIDNPTFTDEFFGDDDDTVIVVESDPAKAYPTRILNYHEIVNDKVDNQPIAATWCPLCGSGIVYGREVDGRVLTFGVSGKLADDDLVMYDRETGSEWKQSLGECIKGELKGRTLDVVPSMTSWKEFESRYPDGLVLAPPGGKSEAASSDNNPDDINYSKEPYEEYFEAEGFGLNAHRGKGSRGWNREDLNPKDIVLGVEIDGEALAFPFREVHSDEGVVESVVGGTEIVVFATDENIHAYKNPGYNFTPTGDGDFEGDGTLWDPTMGKSDDGRKLERVPSKRMFAFAWQDDHGSDSFYAG
ncbi:MAG: DUF3179 domain-containing protein [Halobacteria archaeon]|nr:DUF3179 domain-containing protein [Halobacteria archaeon]